MNSLEMDDSSEEDEVGLSFNKEKVEQSKMKLNNFMQELVSSTNPSDSIKHLLLKEPKGDLIRQAWQDELEIKMCLWILEQKFDRCLEQFNARAGVLETLRSKESHLKEEVEKLQKEKKDLGEKLTRSKAKLREMGQSRERNQKKGEEEKVQRLGDNPDREGLRGKQGERSSSSENRAIEEAKRANKIVISREIKPSGSTEIEVLINEAQKEDCRKRKVTSEPEATKRSKKTAQTEHKRDGLEKSKIFPHASSKACQPYEYEEVLDEAKILVPETVPMLQDTALPEAPVPETVAVLEEGERVLEDDLVPTYVCPPRLIVEEQIFPGPAGLLRRSIPETPEKVDKLMPAPDHELRAGVKKMPPPSSPPVSPVIKAAVGKERSRSKLRLASRVSDNEMDRKKFAKKSLASQEDGQAPLAVNEAKVERDRTKKVGKIAPSLQGEIDKKTFKDFDKDFPDQKYLNVQHESDSDFESPNLLARRPRRVNKETMRKDGGAKLRKKEEEAKDEVGESIENPNSSVELIEAEKEKKIEDFVSPVKRQKSVTKSTNRWGMEVETTTNSQKKRLRNQKQAKIDGFFKNPPCKASNGGSEANFKRISHADTDMERALILSRQSVLKTVKTRVELEMEEEDKEAVENRDPEVPTFAHIGPTVRKKEERKKLLGFECRECQEYYQALLEEGFSKDQILARINDCSRHRGLFKPPLTPEKFWDPLIVEDDTQDPRNKTQEAPPLRRRAERKEEVARRLAAPGVKLGDQDLRMEVVRKEKHLKRGKEKGLKVSNKKSKADTTGWL